MPIIEAHKLNAEQGNIDVYNGFDCCMTFEIWEALKPLEHLTGPIYAFERALQGPVLEMMLRGFKVDPGAREKGIYELRERLKYLSEVIDAIAEAVGFISGVKGKPEKYPKPKLLNPESTKQLQRFFYDYLKIQPITKWVKGKETTPMDRDTLEQLEIYFIARPIVNAIKEYRDTISQLEVFESEVDPDWRIRTVYNIASTDTGRFSSTKSINGTGRNLQNIEEGLRHIFIADEGYKLYGIDLEQAESREVGLLCGILFGDWSYLDACESGDLHTDVARDVWEELPWTGDIKKDREIADSPFYQEKSRRDMTKVLGHGSNYLGKPMTMSMHTKIPESLVKDFQRRYFKKFPCIPRLHHWVANELQSKRQLTNVFGRTRDFFGRVETDETLRAGMAFLPQSATADRLNIGMWRLWRYMPSKLPKPEMFRLMAQLHDATYFQVHESIPEEEVAKLSLSLVQIPQIFCGRQFMIPGEIKVGKNWGKFDKKTPEKNPGGLKKISIAPSDVEVRFLVDSIL